MRLRCCQTCNGASVGQRLAYLLLVEAGLHASWPSGYIRALHIYKIICFIYNSERFTLPASFTRYFLN